MDLVTKKLKTISIPYRLLFATIFLLVGLILVLVRLNSTRAGQVEAGWFDDAYSYRQLITITHNADIFANRAVGVSVSTSGLISASKMQSDCDDTRFTDPSGKALVYELTSGCNGTNTQYKVVLPKISNGTNYIYVYYGNPTAISASQSTASYTSLTPSTPGPVAATEEQGNGPVAYWKFDEGRGTTANDASTNNISGTISGPTWNNSENCISGKCLYFNTNIVSMGSPTKLAFPFLSSSYSLSAWVKPQNPGTDSIIMVKNTSNYVSSSAYYLNISSGKFCGTNENSLGPYLVCDSTSIVAGRWYHLVYKVVNSAHYLYVNGVLVNSGSIGYEDLSGPDSTFEIGSVNFQGYIDEPKVYNYARSTAQINTDYNSYGNLKGSAANLGVASTSSSAPPVAYWNFETGTGTTAYDVGGSNFHSVFGSGTAAPTWSTGKYGKGLSFDGSQTYSSVAHNSIFTTGTHTIDFWVYPDNSFSGTGTLISKYNNTVNGGYTIEVDSTNKRIRFAQIDSVVNPSVYSTTNSIPWGKWTHVAITRNSITSVKIYINGTLDNFAAGSNTFVNSTNPLYFGRDSASSTNFFKGNLDQVHFYDYVRTQKQIIQDMNGGHPAGGSPVGSMGLWYKFNEGQGSTINNSGSIGSTLNALSAGTSAPSWTLSGNQSVGISLNGSSQYTRTPDDPSIRYDSSTASFSLSAWVKRGSTGSAQNIISKEDADNDGWRLQFDAGNTITCSVNATDITSTATVTDITSWHHIVCSVDRAGSGYIYLDGKLVTAATVTSGITMATTSDMLIGARSYTPANYFAGLIDDVKIYSFPLTADDVKIDYNQNQSQYFGSLSTASGGTLPSSSKDRSYCIPGDTSTCTQPTQEWNFNEGTGTSLYETSVGTGHAVMYAGTSAPTWISGKNGKGLLVNYNQGQGATSSDNTYQKPSSITVEAWVKPSGDAATSCVLCLFDDVMFTFNYDLNITGSKFQFGFRSNTAYNIGTSETIVPDRWYHVVGTRDSATGSAKIYVNGILKNTISTPVQALAYFAPRAVQFGWGGSLGSVGLDEVKIFDYVRTPAQVAWDYNQGKPYVHYKLDECQGTTINDSMGTGFTGTWSGSGAGTQTAPGSCSTNASTAWYNGKNGRYNSSLNFDGTDDFVQIQNESAFDFEYTQPLTISAWVKPNASGHGDIWSKQTMGGTTLRGLYLNSNADTTTNAINFGEFYNFSSDEWLEVATTSTVITSGTWNHILITYTGSGTCSGVNLYLNGKQLSDKSCLKDTLVWPGNTILNDIKPQISGDDGSFGNYSLYEGQIDDVKIFTYPLTPAQVKTLYNGGAANFAPITGTP